MPNVLYERDILASSRHQADLLRRLARGEQVSDIDWAHVAEEIDGVGLSKLHAVESFLNLIMVHLLKLQAWQDDAASDQWHAEIVAFQSNARRRFTPSMRQRIELDALYSDAVKQMRAGDRRNQVPRPWPDANPLALDSLLTGEADALVRQLSAPPPS
jgi:hypothetical protein